VLIRKILAPLKDLAWDLTSANRRSPRFPPAVAIAGVRGRSLERRYRHDAGEIEGGSYASTFSLYDRQRSTPSPDLDSAVAVAAMRS
jgi:hypothetical protein